MALFIVEGPDCAGKSTLVNALNRQLTHHFTQPNVIVRHAGPPHSHPLDEYELPLVDYVLNAEQEHIICDRWHLGELVYPGIFGRPTQLDEAVFQHIEMFLQARGALVVLVDAPLVRLRECLEVRGDDLVVDEQLEAIRSGFHDVVKRTRLPVVHLDHDDARDPQTVNWLIAEAMNVAQTSWMLRNFVTYIGPRWPRLLLLGDVRATGTDPVDRRPAFMPYRSTSGHYLLRALAETDLSQVGIANACDVDNVTELLTAFGTGSALTVVTLGVNAKRVVPQANRHVPHPQWFRRFHHRDIDVYRDAILGVRPWIDGQLQPQVGSA